MVGYQLVRGVNQFFNILSIVLMVYCVMSFFARGTKLFAILDRFIEPLRRPFMPITMYLAQRGFPLDVSIILLWITMRMVQSLVTQIIYMFMGIW